VCVALGFYHTKKERNRKKRKRKINKQAEENVNFYLFILKLLVKVCAKSLQAESVPLKCALIKVVSQEGWEFCVCVRVILISSSQRITHQRVIS